MSYTWNLRPSDAPRTKLTVATCQFPTSFDIAANARAIVRLIARAAGQGADVAHFPECALSGYGPAAWPDWTGFDWQALDAALLRVREACRKHGVWAVMGSAVREAPARLPLNSVLVIDSAGAVAGRYDKRRCSVNDLRAFSPGREPLVFEIKGVSCGALICLEWAFPELWQDYVARGVELVFLSCQSANASTPRLHAHTIPPLMQGYAFLHSYAISVSNCARRGQDFASQFIERNGLPGRRCRRNAAGLVLNNLPDDDDQEAFYAMVRAFRASASDGSLYAASHGAASHEQPSPTNSHAD